MKLKQRSIIRSLLLGIIWGLILLASTPVFFAQDPEDQTRGAFLKSRQKASVQRPRPQNPAIDKSNQSGGGLATQSSGQPPKQSANQTVSPAQQGTPGQTATQPSETERVPLALGYTIFLEDKAKNLFRVGADHIFKAGDRIKIVVESNIRGYIYVFYHDADGSTPMIYPSHLIDNGKNLIEAHEPYQIPPDDPKLQGRVVDLEFDKSAESQSLLLVLARRPIAGVLVESQLAAYCRGQAEPCLWNPSGDIQKNVLKRQEAAVITSKSSEAEGEKIAATERQAHDGDNSRGLGMKLRARLPAVIKTYASSSDEVLVVECPLIQEKTRR